MAFAFKLFIIEQNRCAMKVGTDGVLLGAWAEGGEQILDVGTGTGVIAMMMAQRYPGAHVDAIDIDQDSAEQARENADGSPFGSRIDVYASSFQEFESAKTYDAIVSNPPFFMNSMRSENHKRNIARHADTLEFSELIERARHFLKPNGYFSVILPTETKNAVEQEAILQGFSLSRSLALRSKIGKSPFRYLLEFRLTPTFIKYESQILLTDSGERSEWYANLTADFYL